VVLHDGTHQLKVSGSSEHAQATDVIQIEPPGTCRTPDGSCAFSAWADGTARWVLPHATSSGSVTQWVLTNTLTRTSQFMVENLQESAPALVAEIARLQVVSAALHAPLDPFRHLIPFSRDLA
jgi:hypothetical protein